MALLKEIVIKNKYFFGVLGLAVLSVLVSYFYIGYHRELFKDAIGYAEAADFLQGRQSAAAVPMNRILTTPLFLYSVIFINFFLKDFSSSLAVFNLIFYFLCVGAFFLLAREIYHDEKTAFWGALLVAANFYLIDPGNAHLADMAGWFFFILSTYLAVRYFNSADRRFYLGAVAAAAVGFLFKEYGGLGLVSLFLLIALADGFSARRKLGETVVAGALFLVPFLAYHTFVYLQYHYSYFDWYSSVKTLSFEAGRQARGLAVFVKILGWLFSFGWLIWLIGLKKEWQERNWRRWKILAAILPASLFFVIWPEIAQRLAFILVPWLALSAGLGLSRMNSYRAAALTGLYVLANYNIKFLINIINLPF